MHKIIKKIGITLLSFSLMFPFQLYSPSTQTVVQAAENAKIHYLTLPENTEAILLECNGKFGMVDSGEDTDYPSGDDPRYPDRGEISKGFGYEDDVIAYLQSVGVTEDNFEFYIGTHPHSDHIGSADEIIRAFHPKRVYIQEYKDSYISNSGNLWDNLYVYDNMITAALETGATLIQNFDPAKPLYPETVSYSGSLNWTDGNNKDGLRPTSVQVVLANQDTGETQSQSISPDSSGNWNFVFENLQKYDDDKTAYNYSVSLENIPSGYSVIETSAGQFTLIHIPSLKSDWIPVNWKDEDSDGSSRPSEIDIEIQKKELDSSTDTASWEAVQSLTITSDETGAWGVASESLPLTDESGNTCEYRLIVLTQSSDYIFETEENDGAFVIQAIYTGDQTVSSYGLTDEPGTAEDNTGTSDNLRTSTIPVTDQVDPENTLDPNNSTEDSVAAQTGLYDDQDMNTTSTPVFTLGEDMTIRIMNYDTDYKINPKPDANYFCLGVLVEANGIRAFLAGDINNYEGTETVLAEQLEHVDLLTLGHHGYYGSNTYSYVDKLNPKVMVMAGTFSAVSNQSINGEIGTLDTLLTMGEKGIPLYVTGWYHDIIPALVFNFDSSLSNNIPDNLAFIGGTQHTSPYEYIYYLDGIPTQHTGWVTSNGYTCYYDNSMHSVRDKWIQDSDGRYSYLNSNGELAIGWVCYENKWYYLDDSGCLKTGWINDGDSCYYTDSSGAMVTGVQTINGAEYYFSSSGIMVTSTWVNNKYYGADGKWIPDYKNQNWQKDNIGWWYQRSDGSWPASQWELIDGSWYYFNSNGYMCTGWLLQGGTWYYLKSSGAMVTGMQKIGNYWYYFNSSGAMQTGWVKYSNSWYYFGSNGSMYGQGWHLIDGKWYYMYASGAMAANTWIGSYYVGSSGAWIKDYSENNTDRWIKSGSLWWYRHADGSYTRSDWEKINGKWYYFDANGWMKTGWLKLGNTWYYLTENGDRVESCWKWINGKCYYFYSNGSMASNTTIDGYYVDVSGAWIP